MRIGVLDYGVGNLYSLKTALEKLGIEPIVTCLLRKGDGFQGIILPGVGNFSVVTRSLGETRDFILDWVQDGGPVMGVCLGMQLFFQESEEGPGEGLALFQGKVRKLPPSVKIPHMGWNLLKNRRANGLLDGVAERSWVYFVHSFYPEPVDRSIVAAETEYGIDFASVVCSSDRKNIFGTQFHPEKSGITGEMILKNFVQLCRS